MNEVRTFIAVTCIALVTAGCGRLLGGGGTSDDTLVARSDSVTLHVKNQNFYDATLYLIWRTGRRFRLGSVGGNGERDFSFRWEANDLWVEIHLLSVEGSYQTPPMAVDKGDELELVVEPGLDRRIRFRRP